MGNSKLQNACCSLFCKHTQSVYISLDLKFRASKADLSGSQSVAQRPCSQKLSWQEKNREQFTCLCKEYGIHLMTVVYVTIPYYNSFYILMSLKLINKSMLMPKHD